MDELIKKIEALLFSSGRKMTTEELCRLCRESPPNIIAALAELKKQYAQGDSSLVLFEEADGWKISVREQFMNLVQNVVTETELPRGLTETLAVIAFKYPVTQSEIVKIRSNKAYDHLDELETAGYITRSKQGRTKKITLTQKFFDYFELPPDELKKHFSKFEDIAKEIEKKEKEILESKDKKETADEVNQTALSDNPSQSNDKNEA